MLLVISPSKTQTTTVPVRGKYSSPLFAEQAEQLVTLLRKLTEDELATLMKMSKKLAQINYQRFQQFQFPFTPDNSYQALFTFEGDQFQPMDVQSYDEDQLGHAHEHLAVLSGLYGMIRPLDLMQPYRLEMATKLSIGSAVNLYQFWGEIITEQINSSLQNDPYPLLVNLASAEYFKVIQKKTLQVPILTLSFKQYKDGQLKTIAIYAKRARGAMVNFMISEKISDPVDLKGFSADGYSYASDLSTDNEWVFTRLFG